MKKALVFVLAVVMVMAMAVPASAAINSPTAPTTSETTTAPTPVVVEGKDDSATVAFVPVEDVKNLPEEAQKEMVAAQNALAEAAPAGMKAQYFCYVTVEKSDAKADEAATITLKIDNAKEVVVKQFVDGKWVELEAVVNADGTVTVKGVVDGPIAIFTK